MQARLMGHFFVVSEIVTQAFSIYPFLGGRGLWAGGIPLLLHTIINRAAKARGRKGKRIVFPLYCKYSMHFEDSAILGFWKKIFFSGTN